VRSAERILSELERFGIRLGLDHLQKLYRRLGEPARELPAVLVAGTNGKGSTAALLEAIVRGSGYRVGLYTSPHLESVNERLRIDGASIAEARLAARLEQVLAAAQELGESPPTFFEALTLAAFLELAAARPELAILEVGMGGRLDATNLATPRLAVVSAIDFDHQQWLGPTLAAIAREKAGILRAGRPAVFAAQPPEAAAALASEAARLGALPTWVAEDIVARQVRSRGLAGLEVALRTRQASYRLAISLAGRHQAENLSTAVVAAELLRAQGFDRLTTEAIERGAASCRWPGRLESIALPGGRILLLDAAHNPGGCRTLSAFLDELGQPHALLFGALSDKSIPEMLPPLAERAGRLVLTDPPSSRAAAAATLERWAPAHRALRVEPDFRHALDVVLAGDEPLVVVCGSIYLIGAVRRELRARFGAPPALSA